jgi:hypothetical protein
MRRAVLGALAAGVAAVSPGLARADDVELAQESRASQLTAAADTLAWSHFDPATSSYRLMIADAAGVRPASVAPSATDLDADMGLDAAGAPVAVYPRCDAGRCSVWLYDPSAQFERQIFSSPCKVAEPSLDGARIAYARTCRGSTEVVVASVAVPQKPLETMRRRGTVVDLELGTPGVLVVEREPCLLLFCVMVQRLRYLRPGREAVLAEVYAGDSEYASLTSPMFDGQRAVFVVSGSPAYVRRVALGPNGAQEAIRIDSDLGYAALTGTGMGLVTGQSGFGIECINGPCRVGLRRPRPSFTPIPNCAWQAVVEPCRQDIPLLFRGRTRTGLLVTVAWWRRDGRMEISAPPFRTGCARRPTMIALGMPARMGRFSGKQEGLRLTGRLTRRRVTGRIVPCAGRPLTYVARPVS